MRYMVTLGFDIKPGEKAEAMALVPREQAHVAELRERGIVEVMYLSADRAHVWLVMHGESQAAVERELSGFPLFRFMRPELALLA
jgi:hypothetical protein